MIDIYEIRFKDADTCTIKICQKDQSGEQVTALDVCLKYKESGKEAITQHISIFFQKHPTVKTFDESKDELRMIKTYKFIMIDDSELIVDSVPQIESMEEIKKAKAQI